MVCEVTRPEVTAPRATMHLDAMTPADFVLRLSADGSTTVLAIAGSLITEWTPVTIEVRDGMALIPDDHILQVVIHRHGRIEPTPVIALLAGRGEWTGAVATAVARDTHNLVVLRARSHRHVPGCERGHQHRRRRRRCEQGVAARLDGVADRGDHH
jgi:adenine deaminase